MFIRRFTAALSATLALAAVFSATAATAASIFNGENFPLQVSGKLTEGNHVFMAEDSVSLSCAQAEFSGEAAQPSATLTLTPAYAECKFFGVAATVAVNGCAYVLHGGEELSENNFAGTMDISCPAGKAITIVGGNCEVQIGSQSGLTGVEYIDKPTAEPKAKFVASLKPSGLKYNKVKDGVLCPLTGTGEKEGGSYSGRALVAASLEAESYGFTVVKAGKTKLCKEDPKGVACKNAYGATAIEAESTKVFMQFGTESIVCTESKVNASTKAEAEEPLILENFQLSFNKCNLGKNACTSITMAKTPASLTAWIGGLGNFDASVSLTVECLKVKCLYVSPLFTMGIFPGMAAVIKGLGQTLKKDKLAGEENCEPKLVFGAGDYAVKKPGPLWVST